MRRTPRPHADLAGPVSPPALMPDGTVDFAPDDVPVPCRHCACWHHALVHDADGAHVLREWHAHDCPELRYWREG